MRSEKKRCLILFELLIALSLIAILLTFLFSFFVETAKLEKKLETARTAISNRGHLQTRLQHVFSAIDRGGSEPFLYTEVFEKEKTPSLVLLFDNGIDPDPAYSGTVLGRIYLDDENNLSLASWPNQKEKKSPWRKEVLLPHVKSFQFEFLGDRNNPEKKEAIKTITPNLAWRTVWGKSQMQLPSLIRLEVEEKNEKEPLHFAYLLPASNLYISYLGGK